MSAGASRLRVGVAANLDAGGSVHRATFERAVELAREDFGARLELEVENDHARFEGGAAAARRLLERSVDLVIGHYASAAAAGAAPLYDAARIPLLLPAATADALVREHSAVFRICDPDARMVEFMLDGLARMTAVARVAVLDDGSAHGAALASGLRSGLQTRPGLVHEPDRERADAAAFAGLFDASVDFVRAARAGGVRGPILLADDAAHPAPAERLGPAARHVSVYGFEPPEWCDSAGPLRARYRARHGGEPGTYFLETYAAFEIAHAAALIWGTLLNSTTSPNSTLGRVIAGGRWRTALGRIRFERGEGGRGRRALWRVSETGLRPERAEPAPESPPVRRAHAGA